LPGLLLFWYPDRSALRYPFIDASESLESVARSNNHLHDKFFVALAALGGSAGNGPLRKTLEWNESRYETVKRDRLARGLIVPGCGRGGSVAMAVGSSEETFPNGLGVSSTAAGRRSRGSCAHLSPPALIRPSLPSTPACARTLAAAPRSMTASILLAAVPQVTRRAQDSKTAVAALEGLSSTLILDLPCRWHSWAVQRISPARDQWLPCSATTYAIS
jgi:type I restriction enzyme M protein